jgi:hypothetical protein
MTSPRPTQSQRLELAFRPIQRIHLRSWGPGRQLLLAESAVQDAAHDVAGPRAQDVALKAASWLFALGPPL